MKYNIDTDYIRYEIGRCKMFLDYIAVASDPAMADLKEAKVRLLLLKELRVLLEEETEEVEPISSYKPANIADFFELIWLNEEIERREKSFSTDLYDDELPFF